MIAPFLHDVMILVKTLSVLVPTLLISLASAKCLLREPPDSVTPPQQTDVGFYLEISRAPTNYEAGHLYTVSLRVRDFYLNLVLARVEIALKDFSPFRL